MSERLLLGGAPGPIVEIETRGATLRRLEVAASEGRRDVVVPLDPPVYAGTIGRTTNRIAGARFTLDGTEYALGANDGESNLHGGPEGWDARDWSVVSSSDRHVELALVSPDGDQGFPGEARASARYEIVDGPDGPALETTYRATVDAPSPVSMTNHVYFRLAGETIHDHVLRVDADAWLPSDASCLPLGEVLDPAGTPLDLRSGSRLGDVVASGHEQVDAVRGIDHAYVLGGAEALETWRPGGDLRRAAVLEAGGLRLVLETDQVSVQVYTGQALPDPYAGVALEPQHLPDSLHHPAWPTPVLRPGETYTWRSRITVVPAD